MILRVKLSLFGQKIRKIIKGKFFNRLKKRTSLILAHSAQLARSAQICFLIQHFNQKSTSLIMCKKIFYTFLHL